MIPIPDNGTESLLAVTIDINELGTKQKKTMT